MMVPYFHGCASNVKIGIPSGAIVSRTPSGQDVVVVSAGSNDPANPALLKNLEAIRARAGNAAVIWILPIAARPRALVQQVASKHKDRVVSFAAGRDGVHPHYLRPLADEITAAMP
jgi:hypothetical protein